MKLIDAHIHLDQYRNHKELYELMKKSQNYYLCVSNNIDVFNSLNYFYKEQNNIKFALGANPQTLLQDGFNLCLFKKFLVKTRYVGEIGLDFSSKYIAYKDYQLKVFEDILRSIKGTNKILSIHCNKAENEVFQLLRKYELGHQSIIHWFSGDTKKCMLLSQLGCYFSINANMARKTNFIELIKLIGLNRVLVESDGPHTKISNKTGTNYINKIYDILKERLQIDNFEALVYENFKRLLSV